jgi:hypothetical protein
MSNRSNMAAGGKEVHGTKHGFDPALHKAYQVVNRLRKQGEE